MKKLILSFLILVSYQTFSQNLIICGEIGQNQLIEIEEVINTIAIKKASKKITVFCDVNTLPITILNRKNLSQEIELFKGTIQNSTCFHKKVIDSKDITVIKNRLTNNYPKNIIYTYCKYGVNNNSSDFNNLRSFLNNISSNQNVKKNDVFLLVFSKARPKVSIDFPKQKTTINYLHIRGKSFSESSQISEVIIRVNNGDWNQVDGTETWNINLTSLDIKSSKLKIDALAIDEEGDTSDFLTLKDLKYDKITISSNSFVNIYPYEFENVVPKCKKGSDYCFMFKLSLTDNRVDINHIKLIVENSAGYSVVPNDNDTLEFEMSRGINSKSTEYCLFLPYSYFKFDNTCAINIDDNYYFYYVYEKDPSNIIKTPKTLIHFSSFDSNIQEKTCYCE